MVDVWKLLVTDEIIDLIVKYTNDKIREDLRDKQYTAKRLAASRHLALTDSVSNRTIDFTWLRSKNLFLKLFFK